jgi:hypothetical protein
MGLVDRQLMERLRMKTKKKPAKLKFTPMDAAEFNLLILRTRVNMLAARNKMLAERADMTYAMLGQLAKRVDELEGVKPNYIIIHDPAPERWYRRLWHRLTWGW